MYEKCPADQGKNDRDPIMKNTVHQTETENIDDNQRGKGH